MPALLYSPRFLDHDTGGLSESPERLTHTVAVLREQGLSAGWEWWEPRPATRAQVMRVHDADVLRRLEWLCRRGGGLLDMAPTVVSPESYDVAFLAAGTAIAALEHARSGDPAFALVRPPGHHATPSHSMGFCLFNNIAVAAADLLERGLAERILIVDFDLHHGNGTQDAFAADPRVLFISLHQYPIYPGTGDWGEGGRTVNLPFPAGAGDATYLAALETVIAPLARRFQPDLIALSCGYDAHWAESEAAGAGLRLTVGGYYRLALGLRALANELCGGRIAGVLEGGYHLDALAYGVLNTLHALSGAPAAPDPLGPPPRPETDCSAVLTTARARYGID